MRIFKMEIKKSSRAPSPPLPMILSFLLDCIRRMSFKETRRSNCVVRKSLHNTRHPHNPFCVNWQTLLTMEMNGTRMARWRCCWCGVRVWGRYELGGHWWIFQFEPFLMQALVHSLMSDSTSVHVAALRVLDAFALSLPLAALSDLLLLWSHFKVILVENASSITRARQLSLTSRSNEERVVDYWIFAKNTLLVD